MINYYKVIMNMKLFNIYRRILIHPLKKKKKIQVFFGIFVIIFGSQIPIKNIGIKQQILELKKHFHNEIPLKSDQKIGVMQDNCTAYLCRIECIIKKCKS